MHTPIPLINPQGLIGLQNAWARLATDAGLRARFAADPVGTLCAPPLSELSLDFKAQSALKTLPMAHLERFAQGLLSKRAGEFRKAVPSTRQVAPEIAHWYRDWLAHHPAPAEADQRLDPGVAEGLRAMPALLERLNRAISLDEGVAAYAPCLLRFELNTTASAQDGAERIFATHHRADVLMADLRAGLASMDPDPQPGVFRCQGRKVQWRPR